MRGTGGARGGGRRSREGRGSREGGGAACRAAAAAHLLHGVHTHAGAVDLDLVGVHGCVGHQDAGILDALGLPHPDALVKDEALI